MNSFVAAGKSMAFGRWKTVSCLASCMFALAAPSLLWADSFFDNIFAMRVNFAGYGRADVLTNFPALVVLGTNLAGFSYNQFTAPSDGGDLRVWDSQRKVQLNYEVEKWDPAGQSYIWVQVPELVGTNTSIYLSWGNFLSTNHAACVTNGSVWSANYNAVWHFGEASGNALDSTTNHYDGVVANGPLRGVAGQVGGCISLNGNNQYVNFGTVAGDIIETQAAFAISLWVYHRDDSSNLDGFLSQDQAPYAFAIRRSNGWQYMQNDNGLNTLQAPKTGVWENIAITFDSTRGREFYINGLLATNDNYTVVTVAGANNLYLGLDYTTGGGRYPPVDIDETSISLVTRSSNWIWACYVNQASNLSFCSYDAVVERLPGTVIRIK